MNKTVSPSEQWTATGPFATEASVAAVSDGPSPTWPGPIEAAVRRWAASSRRDEIALESAEGALTFGELDRLGDRLARHLRETCPCDGKVIAILADRTPRIVPAVLAILRAGAAFCIIDKAYPASRILHMLTVARPKAIIDISDTPSPEHPAPRIVLPSLATDAVRELLIADGGTACGQTVQPGPDDPACVTFTSGSTGLPMTYSTCREPWAAGWRKRA